MTRRMIVIMSLILLASVACFGQTTYMGITPGKSTKAEAERAFGPPVKKHSDKLVEYKGSGKAQKVFVQYRDGSPASAVERVELIICAGAKGEPEKQRCTMTATGMQYEFANPQGAVAITSSLSASTLDAFKQEINPPVDKTRWYFGTPLYIVRTDIYRVEASEHVIEVRLALYSKELYEAAAPKGNCTGMLRGEWDTNRGRMTIARVDEVGQLRGTYSNNNGTFTGESRLFGAVSGKWRDDTGSGTMELDFMYGQKEFKGTWKRTSGTGPAEGTWEGRCVGASSVTD